MMFCIFHCVLCHSKVYLGYKKSNPCKKYAIKVMKKAEMINKNMVNQGKCHFTFTNVIFMERHRLIPVSLCVLMASVV